MSTRLNDDYDPRWGRFPPNMRFNVDQSPLPFVIDHKRTYEVVDKNQRYDKVWIQQPGSGLDKRQWTLASELKVSSRNWLLYLWYREKDFSV